MSLSAAKPFHSQSYGYNLEIPDDWIQIPQEALQQAHDATFKGESSALVIYDSGFQHGSGETWFTSPYVIIQPMPYAKLGIKRQVNEDEFPKCVRLITGQDMKKQLDKNVTQHVRQLMSNIVKDKGQLDAANRRYFWTFNMDLAGVGPIRGLCVGHFGRESIVQVLFYTDAASWDSYEDARLSMMDSFRFDPDKAYSAAVAAANPTPKAFLVRLVERSLIVGAVSGAIAALIAVITAAVRRKSQRA